MGVIAKAAVIIHNMVVDKRRNTYKGDGARGLRADADETIPESLTQTQIGAAEVQRMMNSRRGLSDSVKVKGLHRQLMNALVEHIWQLEGQ